MPAVLSGWMRQISVLSGRCLGHLLCQPLPQNQGGIPAASSTFPHSDKAVDEPSTRTVESRRHRANVLHGHYVSLDARDVAGPLVEIQAALLSSVMSFT